MQVRTVLMTPAGFLWVIAGLPLAVVWAQRGMPLFLETFPWPGADQGVSEPVGTERYMTYEAASAAAHRYVAALPE